jgi:hypothetical protein
MSEQYQTLYNALLSCDLFSPNSRHKVFNANSIHWVKSKSQLEIRFISQGNYMDFRTYLPEICIVIGQESGSNCLIWRVNRNKLRSSIIYFFIIDSLICLIAHVSNYDLVVNIVAGAWLTIQMVLIIGYAHFLRKLKHFITAYRS